MKQLKRNRPIVRAEMLERASSSRRLKIYTCSARADEPYAAVGIRRKTIRKFVFMVPASDLALRFVVVAVLRFIYLFFFFFD